MINNSVRKLGSLVLVFILAVGSLTACTGSGLKKDKGKDEALNVKKAKGRYIEEEIEIPLGQDEKGVGFFRKKDGGYMLFTYLPNEKKYNAYESADGKSYQPKAADWLNNLIGGSGGFLKKIFQGDDGKIYALYYKENGNHLVGTEDGSNYDEVPDGIFRESSSIDSAAVMENGDVVTSDGIRGKLQVWSSQEQSKKGEMEQGSADFTDIGLFDCMKKKAVVMDKDNSGFVVYNLEDKNVEQSYPFKDISAGGEYGILKFGKDEDIFYLNRQGLCHINKGASTVETLIEGNISSIGDTSTSLEDFDIGEDDDYFVLYNREGKQGSLVHYTYDKEAKAIPDEQLVIFGLEENETIKVAVSRFQKAHPDIRINYKTGNSQETGTTTADRIRVLNTELLSGNGADILVLDGLPVKSYIEKGVLMNMADFYKDLENESPLLDNIVIGMNSKKGIYQMPVRAKILSMYGTDNEVGAFKSLDTLDSYLDSDGGEGLISPMSYEYYLRLLMTLYYKDLFMEGDRESIPEKELKKLLESAKKLADSVGAEADTIRGYYLKGMPELTEDSIVKDMGTEILRSVDTNNDMALRSGKQAVVKESGGSSDLMVTCAVLEEMKMEMQGINGLYLPRGMVGVNKSSKNKVPAQEFLKLLFSEEIQDLDLGDGFPINEKSLDTWCQKQSSEDGQSIGIYVEGEGEFSAIEPSGQQLKPFVELERNADTPVIMEDAILEVILNEGIAYCKGGKSLDEAVSNITNKTKTYLKE